MHIIHLPLTESGQTDLLRYLRDKNGMYIAKPYQNIRNNPQNAKYWVLLNWVSNESGNDADYLHEMMKKQYLSKKKLVKIGKKRRYVTKIESTTRLSTKAFSEYFARVEQFFAEF